MTKHFTETLVVAGPHLGDLYDEITSRLAKTPPGEIEIRRRPGRKLILRSHNPFTAILSYLYDFLRQRFPLNDFVLTSGREGESARLAGCRRGASVFETYFDFSSDQLPRAAAHHRSWVNTMFG